MQSFLQLQTTVLVLSVFSMWSLDADQIWMQYYDYVSDFSGQVDAKIKKQLFLTPRQKKLFFFTPPPSPFLTTSVFF